MDPYVKVLIGFSPDDDDKKARKEWNRRTKNVCKPCWELKYCPYGPLVEQFPTPPIPRAEMVVHNERLKTVLAQGIEDEERRREIERMIAAFDLADHPEEVDHADDDKACSIFGHYR